MRVLKPSEGLLFYFYYSACLHILNFYISSDGGLQSYDSAEKFRQVAGAVGWALPQTRRSFVAVITQSRSPLGVKLSKSMVRRCLYDEKQLLYTGCAVLLSAGMQIVT